MQAYGFSLTRKVIDTWTIDPFDPVDSLIN